MLERFPVHATVAASDIERARTWYRDRLGLSPKREETGNLWYEFAPGTWLLVYQTGAAGTAQNTQAGWTVTGIETVMEDLRGRGVEFEEYDFGEMKTANGLLEVPGMGKSAWFKDSEGNTFELSEPAA
ncbi:MAG TPA: VOC family protein [Actinomycetota bacterium]|nr:VOC family protein [Actinomycetota bacterium]